MKQLFLILELFLYQNSIFKDSYLDELIDLIPSYHKLNPVSIYDNYFNYIWIIDASLINETCVKTISLKIQNLYDNKIIKRAVFSIET